MKLLNIFNRVIEYSFYLILFLVPLALTGDTSELFEFNKLWVTFILTIVIGAAWVGKIVIKRELKVQRTPLDIPIALFLVSEVLSTIFSMDVHVSLWGYYSRFNGGLFSILSYIFLYYAFVSNYRDIEAINAENENHIRPMQIILFVLGLVVFFGGSYLSSFFIKTTATSMFPMQMTVTLVSALAAFALFMKAAPSTTLKKTFYAILTSMVLVVLWGLPSHFGYDPTCLLFRGTFDVSCWTADFLPKVRVFSTLGQPDWLAAYLVTLVPICGAILLNFVHGKKLFVKENLLKNYSLLFAVLLLVFIAASYQMLLWTISRSAILAMWAGFALLAIYYFWFYLRPKFDRTKLTLDFKFAVALVVAIAAITFINGQPFSQFDIFTWKGIHGRFFNQPVKTAPAKANPGNQAVIPTPPPASTGELGGTDSRIIRSYVWKGAIDIWKNYPILGSGVETYAFAYYKFRPVGHNLTSEWNFLYNKAHNEFLNYLATTGTLGIIAYLSMIATFLYVTLRLLIKNLKKPDKNDLLIYSFLVGYVGILITNFFGFSVVMINILFFTFPAFVFILANLINFDKSWGFSLNKSKSEKQVYLLGAPQKGLLIISTLIGLYLIFVLVRFWQADRYYYFGLNFDQTQDYQRAYTYLNTAVSMRPSEPVFRSEFALNNAIVAASLIYQNQQKPDQQSLAFAKQLLDSAVTNSNRLTAEEPNNIVYAKNRVRIFYTLSQVDPSYLPLTLDAIKKAQVLAPTDADVSYNLGVLLGQTGNLKGGVKELQHTIVLKSNYYNAYYALGIFYHQLGVDSKGKVIDAKYAQMAIDEMKTIIKTFGPNQQAQSALDTWTKGQ